ncbi:hypothetical protein U9M48_010411 [Paspalum notatum var. saurae]|uniref:DUF6598 domain-containing protein n=1 Tax=Paspalum notatum var. saurae TaxID=547442 RepID=A0AAQ3STI1_PASNO
MMARVAAEFKAEWDKNEAVWRAEAMAMRERIEAGEDPEYSPLVRKAKIPNMPFTYKKPGRNQSATTPTTLQIISLKVARIRGGLQWPFHVFGMVAIRDMVDHKRNIIFDRPRHCCQILTQEVPYLQLTGPTRAIVVDNSVTFEVDLKVKGATESEDECLSFLAASYTDFFESLKSRLLKRQYAGKLGTLEFELGSMVYSVEATISVRVTSGSWPDGFRAQFSASTESLGDAEIILLDSGDDKVPVVGHLGSIKLSRCVVTVESDGLLRFSVKAWKGDDIVARRKKAFKAKRAGPSVGTLDIGFCTMSVNIAWSLISTWY